MVFDERSDQLISQTEVEGESRRNFPIVLEEEALLPVVDVHRRPRGIDVSHTGGWQSHDEIREWIRDAAIAVVGHRTSWVPTIHGEAIDCGVAHKVRTHFEVVPADDPSKRISEGGKVLI